MKKTENFISKAISKHGDRYDYSMTDYKDSKSNVIIICKEHGEFQQNTSNHLCGSGCPECSGKKRHTQETFIEKSKKVHNDIYDYSKVNYINVSTKVTIICKEHGEFNQTPNSHLRGSGCMECGGRKQLTNKTFIEKAKEIHGDVYDYSKVNYINVSTKVTIICKEHGEFQQTSNSHLNGRGCMECGGRKQLTDETFIEKAKKIHGDYYDYSKVNYINALTKVTIICKEHGEFVQTPGSHLNGNGCMDCFGSKKLTNKTFIEKATKIHGDHYDYSKVDYINISTKVTIICKEHGEFQQTPNSHLNGNGCMDCCGTKQLTNETFIEKAILKHGNIYDYSKVDYINSSTKVTIICKEHGEFVQTPGGHLNGNGCLECVRSKKLTNKTFIEKATKIHGDHYDYSKTNCVNTTNKVTIICKEHGEFQQKPSTHLSGFGCNICSGQRHTPETFIHKCKEVHNDIYDYSLVDYNSVGEKITIICKKHGKFEQRGSKHLSGQGCPKCNGSKGEKIISDFLIENNIDYISEHKFDDCRDKYPLRFDFYIPSMRTCIEFDGIQHFKPVDFFGGNKNLKEVKRKDSIKNEYCNDNNIKLIRISYLDVDNILRIISENIYN